MWIGSDAANAELVVALRPSGERWTEANDERDVRALAERCRTAALAAASLPVVDANPRQARDFAKATVKLRQHPRAARCLSHQRASFMQ